MPLPPSDPAQPLPDSLPPGEREWPLHERLLGAAARAAALTALPALFAIAAALASPVGHLTDAMSTAAGLWVGLCVPFLFERPDRGWQRAVLGWVVGLALGAGAGLLVWIWTEALLYGGPAAAYQALGQLDASGRLIVPWLAAASGLVLAPWCVTRLHQRGLVAQAQGLALAIGGGSLGTALVTLWLYPLANALLVVGLAQLVGLGVAALIVALLPSGERLAARVDRRAPPLRRAPVPRRAPFLLAVLGGVLIGHLPARTLNRVRLLSTARSELLVLESAQSVFSDRSGERAGSLAALAADKLADERLGGGVKGGYTVRLVRSRTQPSQVWGAAIDPLPGALDDRHLALDASGALWVSDAPIPLDPETCSPLPGTATRVIR